MALRKDCSSGLMRRVSRVLPYYNRVRAPRHRPLRDGATRPQKPGVSTPGYCR
jgi:hypothetical protein